VFVVLVVVLSVGVVCFVCVGVFVCFCCLCGFVGCVVFVFVWFGCEWVGWWRGLVCVGLVVVGEDC